MSKESPKKSLLLHKQKPRQQFLGKVEKTEKVAKNVLNDIK
jgi:hypothetical protein